MSEHDSQTAFFRWAAVQGIKGLEQMHAIPNGGYRHPAVASKLKAEGVKPGVPDVYWPLARGGFIGLAIEFKHANASPSKEQRERITLLQKEGWCVCICWDWQCAARTVQGYAGMMTISMPSQFADTTLLMSEQHRGTQIDD
jgi:hypothetical protein